MKKTILTSLISSAGLMLLIPFLAVTFAKSDAGMAICLILFYLLNPIFSIINGVWANPIKKLWYLPILPPVLFLAGVWIFFAPADPIFYVYAGIYLALGYISALINTLIIKLINSRKK